ncbi:hypothetical protein BLA60_33655 [Actinophytocola xinjiangensis]|uniref:Uncharacterized protein n=1 Tax=Actinophytocola xinjiangensis TaxID=485602 RepID=A0A7Z0WFA9_9PSEU|nr:hypothetical protein [Actinophytocola xinjiangensis]OLF06000.1 hypothetical protein BLA60_33655 [Actinophytocola xinjiangensis]
MAALAPADVLPPDVDGVPTDVLVMRDPRPAGEPLGAVYPATDDTFVDNARHRPLTGGVAMRGSLVEGNIGTLGCLLHAVGDPNAVYALTCHHVLASVLPRYNGDRVYDLTVAHEPQVGTTVCGQNDLKTHSTCSEGIFGRYAGGVEDADCDVAVARVDGGTSYCYDLRQASVPASGDPGDDDVAVTGIAPMPTNQQLADRSYLVRKRGARTGLTGGYVVAAHTEVLFPAPPPDGGPVRVWARDALVFAPHPNPAVPAGEHTHYLAEGDSGSVTVDTANRVLGLNFGRALAGVLRPELPNPPPNVYFGVAFPITTVIARLGGLGLTLAVGTATEAGDSHTVPGRPTVTTLVDGERVVVPVPEPVAVTTAAGPPPAGADRLGADLERSAGGRALLAFWHTHATELRQLVNSDRRVAAVWHRSGGSAVYQVLLRGLHGGTLTVPATVNGQPLGHCLDRLHDALRAAAGEPLRAALDRLRRRLPDLAGLTYPQLLAALADESEGEPVRHGH